MAQGMLGQLPPGLRGMLAAEQMGQQRSQNQLGQIGGILSLQGQMQNQAIQQQGLAEKQQQQERLTQFASQLPEPERAKFMIAPMEYIKEANKKYVIGGALVPGSGGAPIYEAPREMKIGPAGQVYDPRALQAGQVMADPNKPFQIGPQGNPVPNQSYQQYEIDKARAGKANVTTNVLPPQKTFENENKLRDDYTTASKPFVGLRDAYNTVNAALSGPITAVSTLAGATKFMKLIDPESVVRESELQLALKSTGMLDRFMNLHNTVMKGQVLTPNQAKEIKAIADVLYGAAQKQQAKTDEYFGGLATSYGLQPNRVIRNQSAVTEPRRRQADVLEDADRIINGNR